MIGVSISLAFSLLFLIGSIIYLKKSLEKNDNNYWNLIFWLVITFGNLVFTLLDIQEYIEQLYKVIHK